MGKAKRKHNWKARQQVETDVDTSEQKRIKLDIIGIQADKFDDVNAVVLPSKKRKTKQKYDTQQVRAAEKLSKKQRKRLEKIVEQKKKKEQRAFLLESLQHVQAGADEMPLLVSTSAMQSGTDKRIVNIEHTPEGVLKVNSITGSNKKRKQSKQPSKTELEEANSSESESSENETESVSESDSNNDEKQKNDTDQESNQSWKNKQIGEIGDADKVKRTTSNNTISDDTNVQPSKIGTMPRDSKPAVHVAVNRTTEIQESRLQLPILAEEQQIMEAINENPVVILCGETGSGKTTQVPQFLYEAGYTSNGVKIAITEPRRVAAISMSKRVATEMNLPTSVVSYQIRYEGNVTDDTKMKFMTDGVLLKEIEKDFLLLSYSAIIIDEAHERSVYTDILIGLLSRIVPLRNKRGNSLKLIIMSATLRVEDFTENSSLFKVTPPVIKIDSRQFPVTVHFNKRTPLDDYLGEVFKKVCKIHRMLPEGGILVFVTGQQEVHTLCKKLRKIFPSLLKKSPGADDAENEEGNPLLPKIDLDSYSALPQDEEAEMDLVEDQSDDGLSDTAELDDDMDDGAACQASDAKLPLYVLPLYSLLSSDKQAKVFEQPPDGSRLCVIATNVAETSLTIPNVKYVVDCGKVKTKYYDKVTGVSTFQVTWTSKASANQRAGRAGRTGPGHCYRLYSSAVFNDEFELFSVPEIKRRPVDDLVLQMKAMSIDKVINFPFPSCPDTEALKAAEDLLISLGALQKPQGRSTRIASKQNKAQPSASITTLGSLMSKFPVSPRYAKMLALGHQHDLLPYVVAIVSAVSVQEVFENMQGPVLTEEEKEKQKILKSKAMQIRRTWAGSGNSLLMGDLMVLLKAVGACEYVGCTPQFCQQHGLRYKAMLEIRKLRAQLTNTVNSVMPNVNICVDPKMKPPSDVHAKLLRQIVLAGLGDHVARKLPDPIATSDGTNDTKLKKNAFQCTALEEPVYIHPGSVLYKQKLDCVVYQDIAETSRLYMRGVMAIQPEWLPVYAPNFCTFSKPLDDPPPRYDDISGKVMCHMTCTFGRCSWQVSAVELEYPSGLDKYKWFARYLLEGKVIAALGEYVPVLLSAPATMIKTWAKLQPRTETLLKTLISEEVHSCDTLLSVWEKKPTYLLYAYSEWVPQVKHKELKERWPPVK